MYRVRFDSCLHRFGFFCCRRSISSLSKPRLLTETRLSESKKGIVCSDCNYSMEYSRRTKQKHKQFERPAEWKTPDADHSNCYFCLCKQGKSTDHSTMVKPVSKHDSKKNLKIMKQLYDDWEKLNGGLKAIDHVKELDRTSQESYDLMKIQDKKIVKEAPKCIEARNRFCYVCGEYVQDVRKRYNIFDGIQKFYLHCFAKEMDKSDHNSPGKIKALVRIRIAVRFSLMIKIKFKFCLSASRDRLQGMQTFNAMQHNN